MSPLKTGGEPANITSYNTTSIYETKSYLPPFLKGDKRENNNLK
jgi:hypothetical protein